MLNASSVTPGLPTVFNFVSFMNIGGFGFVKYLYLSATYHRYETHNMNFTKTKYNVKFLIAKNIFFRDFRENRNLFFFLISEVEFGDDP